MPESDFSKVFDVSKPKAAPTSRPVIVGHRPIMADPMMTRPPRPATEMTPAQAPSQSPTHQARVISVSDGFRQEVQQTQNAPTPKPETSVPSLPPQSTMVEANLPPNAYQAPANQLPEIKQSYSPEPSMPEVGRVPLAAAPTAPTNVDMGLPHMVTNLPHMNSLPVSHESVTSPSRLKSLLMWLITLIIIGLAGAYIVIDAGLVSTNINLPFHIFSQG